MKKLLVIGAGFLQDFVIKKAKSMGYYTLAVDGNPEAVGFKNADYFACLNIVDEKACLEFAKENNIDGVLTAATDFGVLTASYIAEELGLPGLDYQAAKLVKNKYLVRKRLFEASVDDTEQAYEVGEETDISLLSEKLNFPVMVKPCDGSGSRGASRIDSASGVEAACKLAIANSISQKAVVESFINGHEYGADSLVADGKVYVTGIMKKWMTKPPYYAELGHAMPSGLPAKTEEKVKNCIENAIKVLGINHGSVNMDLLVTDEGNVHIVDVGARMGGNMIGPCIVPYGTGADYMANMIRLAVGDELDFTKSPHGAVCSRLLAFDGGVVTKLPDFDSLEKTYDVEIYHHLELNKKVNEYHTNIDGCGYIIAKADNVEKAEEKCEKVLEIIKDTIFG